MTTIILTRHGHVEGINPPRFRGQHSLALTEQGLEEAQMTAERIASTWRPAIVLTSPLGRGVATGEAIAKACGVQSKTTDDLLDLDYGDWRWKTHEEVKDRWPRQFALWHSAPHLVRFPSGESLQDIVLRSANVFRTVVEGFPSDTIVLVGHDSVNRALLLQLLDQPLSAYWRLAQDPCCINVIEYKNDVVRVVSINDTRHIVRGERESKLAPGSSRIVQIRPDAR
jgi:probable phosphoglycerate mutase